MDSQKFVERKVTEFYEIQLEKEEAITLLGFLNSLDLKGYGDKEDIVLESIRECLMFHLED